MSARAPADVLFLRDIAQRADTLSAAGIGLEGIGLMLSERDLNTSEQNALHHAVIALGAMVKSEGLSLYGGAKDLEGRE